MTGEPIGARALRTEPDYRRLGATGPQPRAVLDTNVWLEWLVFEDPRLAPLRAAVERGAIRLLGYPRCRAELAHVLAREPIARRAAAPSETLLARYDVLVEVCERALEPAPLVCRDPEDQVFLELAFTAGARWLLTRDKALLALARKASRLRQVDAAVRLEICKPEAALSCPSAP